MAMILYIQSMTTLSCQKVFKDELLKLGIEFINIISNEVEIKDELSEELLNTLDINIHEYGMALIKDENGIFAEKVRVVILAMLSEEQGLIYEKNSDYIKRKMGHSYRYTAERFNKSGKMTLQDYIKKIKIDKAKVLIIEGVMSIEDIADNLHYNHTSYFSKQFKVETGFSPSNYKKD